MNNHSGYEDLFISQVYQMVCFKYSKTLTKSQVISYNEGVDMEKVFIVSAKRTAIGSFLGTLSETHPSVYGARLVETILEETNIDPSIIDEVVIGNILPAGLGQGLSRQIAIHGGIPSSVPAYSVNMVCGSGMKSVMTAYANIQAGIQQCVLAGGVESMSKAPFLIDGSIRKGQKFGAPKMTDHMLDDALTDAFNHYHMGITAENIAEKYAIDRLAQDRFAYTSQLRAKKAIQEGKFKKEIVPLTIQTRKETIQFDQDEYPNDQTSLEKLGSLRPAFKKDGSVTAGNSSGLNDGASMMMVVSETFMKTNQLTPLAEIIAMGQGGVDPSVMGLGPTPAIKQALKNSGLDFKDLDLIELNEAFASQSLGVVKELSETFNEDEEVLLEKTNIYGGAIALGHPVGMSGNRIIVTLINALIQENKTFGLASLCIGGGMGTAMIVRKI
jgi:acetyl-CoA C-acetyltransferase